MKNKVQTKEKAKKNKRKKRPLWKRLAAFLVVIAVIIGMDYGVFYYISNIVVENLESFAQTDAQEQIHVGYSRENLSALIKESVMLSGVAYMPEKETMWRDTLSDNGYENIQRIENDSSFLYDYFTFHNNANMAFMFSSVSATIASKSINNGNEDKTLIAIAFRGTDPSDIVDDFSDMFTAVDDEGFHKGFKWNAENFIKKADKIKFNIDGITVTLNEIIEDMKSDKSRYTMIVTGHSLGAAVADVLTGYIFYEQGVAPENFSTVTFGTPKSVSSGYNYPYSNIINITNGDDLVTTVGAQAHLGNTVLYSPTDEFRKKAYGNKYVENGISDYYNDLVGAMESGLIAHNLAGTYNPISEDIINNMDKYFIFD